MNSLLIPSAALIPREMQKRFGKIPAVLFPLNGKPLLEHLYGQYKDAAKEIFLVVCEQKSLVEDYVRAKHRDIHIVELDGMRDLGYTVKCGLDAVAERGGIDGVYVNFADTLIYDGVQAEGKSFSYFSEAPLDATWTFYETDEKGCFSRIYDKKVPECFVETPVLPFFAGCFYLTEWQCFRQELSDVLTSSGREGDSFYAALREFSREHPIELRKTLQWYDVGHDENYLRAKTGVQARSFNTVTIDESRGILRKTSRNEDKFIHEIKWYVKLPNKLQYLIPRIYEYSVSRESPYVSMEYYGYSTLHELLLYGNLPRNRWKQIFEKLRFVLDDMSSYTVSSSDVRSAMREIYVEKTFSRLESIRRQKMFASFFDSPIIINGKNYRPLSEYENLIPEVVDRILFSEGDTHFSIIHGDLCFSNILLEENYGFVRLIDPRGKFGSFDLYGDRRYDIAKLLHSVEGKYDYIIEDLFEMYVDGNQIAYQVQNRTDWLVQVFSEVFCDYITDYQALRLIESTLFLSMIPLHGDHPRRQYAMLATGIQLLDKVMEENGYE